MPLDPALWSMSVTLELDRKSTTYIGPNDHICGTASVSLEPTACNTNNSELFGPLVVNVVLEGELKAKVRVDRGTIETSMVSSYAENRKLFKKQLCLHDAAIRLGTYYKMSWPFDIHFPEHADPRAPRPAETEGLSTACRNANCKNCNLEDDSAKESTSASQPMESLPASFSARLHGSAANSGDVDVVYRIFVSAEMPGLGAHLRIRREWPRTIIYWPPNWHGARGKDFFAQDFTVASRHLLPSSRTSAEGKGKGKSVLKSFLGPLLDRDETTPKFAFRMLMSGFPPFLVPSWSWRRELSFKISLYPRWELSSITKVPEILLKSVKVQLWAFTNIYAYDERTSELQRFHCKEKIMKNVHVRHVEPPGPFAAQDEQEYGVAVGEKRIGVAAHRLATHYTETKDGHSRTISRDKSLASSASHTALANHDPGRDLSSRDSASSQSNLQSSRPEFARAMQALDEHRKSDLERQERYSIGGMPLLPPPSSPPHLAATSSQMSGVASSSKQPLGEQTSSAEAKELADLNVEVANIVQRFEDLTGSATELPLTASSSKQPLDDGDDPPAYLDGLVLTKKITTMPIENITPTFFSANLYRSYELSVQIELSVGKQTVGMTRHVPLVIYAYEPEQTLKESGAAPEAACVGDAGNEQLPTYEEVLKQ